MKKTTGFTLIELMVVVGIVSIMMMIAVPTLKQSMINNRLMFEAQSLYNIIIFSRTEAIRRNDYISVCPSINGTSCSGKDYSKGTIVYLNSAMSGLSTSSQIIKVYDGWSVGDKASFVVGNDITFTGSGNSKTNTISSLLVCNPTYNSYNLNINLIGKTTIIKNTGDGGC